MTISSLSSSSVFCLLLILCAASPTNGKEREESTVQAEPFDVLIYGANAAGVGAAVTASRDGQYRVKMVEPLTMIGGMAAAGGVALMNQGGCGLSGLAKNWSSLVGE
jgi:heterodisulfide reductase subunit A-like polyferredoxin